MDIIGVLVGGLQSASVWEVTWYSGRRMKLGWGGLESPFCMPQLFAYRPIFILFSSSDLLFLQRRADEEESSAISVEAREI